MRTEHVLAEIHYSNEANINFTKQVLSFLFCYQMFSFSDLSVSFHLSNVHAYFKCPVSEPWLLLMTHE